MTFTDEELKAFIPGYNTQDSFTVAQVIYTIRKVLAASEGAEPVSDEREAFDRWRASFVTKHGHMPTEADSWQARAALSAQQAAPKVPEGWNIQRECDGIRVTSPTAGPGGMIVGESGRLSDRLLYALCDAMLAAAPAPSVDAGGWVPDETMQVIGIKDGIETVIGTATITPRMKARDLVREMFGGWHDDDGSEADLAFAVCESLLRWMGNNQPAINLTAAPLATSEQRKPLTEDDIDNLLAEHDVALNNEQRAGVHAAIRSIRTTGNTSEQRKPLDLESLVGDLSEWSRHVVEDRAYESLEKHIRRVLAAHGIRPTGGEHG